MTNLTTEEMQRIVDGAPEGATHYSAFDRCFYKCHNNEWMYCIDGNNVFEYEDDGLAPDDIRNLNDPRKILAQQQEIERLRAELAYYADVVDKMQPYTHSEIECDALADSMRHSMLPKGESDE